MPRKDIYKSKTWKKVRQAVIIRQGGLCNRCKVKPIYIVHHLIELTDENYHDLNIAYGIDNLEGLCLACHNHVTFAKEYVRSDIMFDRNGDVVAKRLDNN